MSKRKADALDKVDPAARVKLRGLEWDSSAAKPAFLRNAVAALSGPASRSTDGRAPVPQRPGTDDHNGPESDEDEWGFGGDEAPAVVVLKEGKHLDQEQVDELRQEAKQSNAKDPLAPVPEKEKAKPSLQFSTGASSKAKARAAVEEGEKSWNDVVKRVKDAGEPVSSKPVDTVQDDSVKDAREKDKDAIQKQKKKEKKKQQKQVGLLSFAD